MTDYSRLVEILEEILDPYVAPVEIRGRAEEALPLARQLIEERKRWMDECDRWVEKYETLREENELLKDDLAEGVRRVDDLIKENKRLKASDDEEHERTAILRNQARDLQARLSATEENLDMAMTRIKFQAKALEEWNRKAEERLDTINKLREENERLKGVVEDFRIVAQALEARLSAAEAQLTTSTQVLWQETKRRKRAEEVVEAVKLVADDLERYAGEVAGTDEEGLANSTASRLRQALGAVTPE